MSGYLFGVVVLVIVNDALGLVPCWPSFCENVVCEDEAVVRSRCQDGRIQPGGSVCGCCPICIHFLDEEERCREEFPMPGPGVITHECREGLFCNNAGLCQRKNLHEATRTCSSIREEATNGRLSLGRFIPRCTADGLYQAVQCRGAGCYCVNVEGESLFSRSGFPYQDHIIHRRAMDCRCARDEDSAHPDQDTHFNCGSNGNYLP